MTNHYALSRTFTADGDLTVKKYNYKQIKLYFNPNDGAILKIDTPYKNIKSAIVYSILGKEIKAYAIINNEIDISDLEKGSCFFLLENSFTEHLIIK